MTRRHWFGSLIATLFGTAALTTVTRHTPLMFAIVQMPNGGDLVFKIRKAATTNAAAMSAIINDPMTTSMTSDAGWVDVIPRPNFGTDREAWQEYSRRLKELRTFADTHRG